MSGALNMLKLSVGTESVAGLERFQSQRAAERGGRRFHVTRMWPKRAEEILDGGSIYWVIQRVILARQAITGFEEITSEDGIRRCAIQLDARIVRTEAVPKRPFQGWRYLPQADAPADLGETREGETDLPPRLMAALAEIGVR
ncbi:hypothetical protein LX81_02034 [Palleronia aestuarii]|uniref:DUF1489 family protein n=1 Tax=Palleronia aestuarii TaxID=568105 RepID=A0A2W7N956_9RHOB|nr:DUF1489 domain-containing protein [Palleronia aestuarii]PZX16183.1 hypothetical protein LX81_02034 [Palleronia aestuarii]